MQQPRHWRTFFGWNVRELRRSGRRAVIDVAHGRDDGWGKRRKLGFV
jgi:hypothetical protein